MLEIMNFELGNASSLHRPHHASSIIEEARAEVAKLINADPGNYFYFWWFRNPTIPLQNIFAENARKLRLAPLSILPFSNLRRPRQLLRNCKVLTLWFRAPGLKFRKMSTSCRDYARQQRAWLHRPLPKSLIISKTPKTVEFIFTSDATRLW